MSLNEYSDDDLKTELEKRKQKKETDQRNNNLLHNHQFREHKDFLMKVIKHNRNTCSDDNPKNGYYHNGHPYCKKCMMMDILDGLDNGDVRIELEISLLNISFDII